MATASLALGLFSTSHAADQRVYRWVDDQGEVHYSKALPPEAASRPYDILSASGILIERVTDPAAHGKPKAEENKNKDGKPEPLYSEEEKRVIGDRLLLLKYRSEQEILEAMDLEIENLKYDERLLNTGYDSVVETLVSEVRAAADQQRAGLDVDQETQQNIAQLQRRLKSNRKSNDELDVRRAKIRATYQADLERYRELVSQFERKDSGT